MPSPRGRNEPRTIRMCDRRPLLAFPTTIPQNPIGRLPCPHSGQRSSGAELAVGSTLLLLLLLLLALSSTRSYLSSRPFPEHASSSSKTQRTARPEGLRAKIWRRSAPLPALRPLCNERFYSSNLRVSSGSSSMEPAVRQISFQKAGSLIREAGEKVEYVAVKMASFQMTAESPLTLNAGGSALARAGDDLSRAESGNWDALYQSASDMRVAGSHLESNLDNGCENLELLADTLENLAESLGMESYSEARAHVEVAADTVEQIGESIQEYSSYFGGAPGSFPEEAKMVLAEAAEAALESSKTLRSIEITS